MKVGDTAYIVESNRYVREVEIRRCSGGMFLVRFTDTGGGIQVKAHRLFATREEAEKSIEKAPETKKVRGNPYDRWYLTDDKVNKCIRGNLLLFAEKSVDGSRFIFLSGKSKNQESGLLGTVGGGFWLWKKLN